MNHPVSRQEKNFSRLLSKCESLVTGHSSGEWRLEQYVKDLEERLVELKKMNTCQPSKDTLASYSHRVEFLRGVIEAEKLPTVSEKAMANQLLSPGTPNSVTNKIYQQTKAKYFQEMRQELLGTKDEPGSPSAGLRMRLSKDNIPQDDFDAVLRYHNSMQEKVAEEMVSLVHSLKQNSLLAGHIIRKDTEVLEKSAAVADDRHSELKVESERLEIFANKSCNWCIWLILALVCMVFMWMIVFIRLFPKR